MFDWKEFFPSEALGPAIGGLLLWFGFNYIFFAPTLIAPRLEAVYYAPICQAAIKDRKDVIAAEMRSERQALEKHLNEWAATASQKVMNQMDGAMDQVFGNSEQGQALNQLFGMLGGGNAMRMGIEMKVEQEKQRLRAELADTHDKRLETIRAATRIAEPAAYCRCNVAAGFENRFDLALYTSSLRLFTPKMINDLENGHMYEAACGSPPVL